MILKTLISTGTGRNGPETRQRSRRVGILLVEAEQRGGCMKKTPNLHRHNKPWDYVAVAPVGTVSFVQTHLQLPMKLQRTNQLQQRRTTRFLPEQEVTGGLQMLMGSGGAEGAGLAHLAAGRREEQPEVVVIGVEMDVAEFTKETQR